MAVYSENQTEQMNALGGQNLQLLSVKHLIVHKVITRL
jgi:hypothetical protein